MRLKMSDNINTRHPEYNKWLPLWIKTRDAIEGQDKVKSKGSDYLKPLNGQTSDSYNAYLNRAMFTDYSSRTVEIGLGQLFRKTPLILGINDDIVNRATLDGKSMYYLSKTIATEILAVNRVGILVDYSIELERPYLTEYKTENIINWKTGVVNGQEVLTLVVLEGSRDAENDKYTHETVETWRTLELEDNVYIVRDWERTETSGFAQVDEFVPIMNNSTMSFIPFYFLTTNSINFNLTKSPMLGFTDVNYGHYINSADYENMLHWTGAKTPILTGYPPESTVTIGSAMVLEKDGTATYLEASSDSGLKEELQHKESQMAALGTSLISGSGRYVQSAETARITSSGEYATLADISNAMSSGMTHILKVMAEWNGATESQIEDVSVQYNKDYESQPVDPTTITALGSLVQASLMSWEAMVYNMRNMEAYPDGWTIDDERKAIEDRQESMVVEEEVDLNKEEETGTNQDIADNENNEEDGENGEEE